MMEAVHRFEGTVNQVLGDGIMALFGAPLAHEDHAARACYAALAMQTAMQPYADAMFRSHGITVRIRVGLNSGEVVVRTIGNDLHMDYSAVGHTTHLAARMEQLAAPGSSTLTRATLRLVEGLVHVKARWPVPVKGMTEPVEVYELTGASSTRTPTGCRGPWSHDVCGARYGNRRPQSRPGTGESRTGSGGRRAWRSRGGQVPSDV